MYYKVRLQIDIDCVICVQKVAPAKDIDKITDFLLDKSWYFSAKHVIYRNYYNSNLIWRTVSSYTPSKPSVMPFLLQQNVTHKRLSTCAGVL